MKIEKFIELSENIEIELSSDDIMLIFDSEPDSLPQVLRGLNSVASFLKGISDEKIKEMQPESRKIVVDFLSEQAKRFNQNQDKR